MGSLTIRAISLLGRYSVLLLLPPAVLAAWGWFVLFEHHKWPAIIVGVPFYLAVLSTVVLVLGILLANVGRPTGITVDRSAAPELWDYWDKASPAGATFRRQIIIDADINAAMAERVRFAGVYGRDQTLTLGLGLLILLDRAAVEAVLEHEFAHAQLKHSSGLTRIHEFLMTYAAFDGYVARDMPAVSLFLEFVFTSFAVWLERRYRRLSRIQELQADRQSADKLGTGVTARALILTEGCFHSAKAMVLDPLEKEILGAISVPKPHLDRLLENRSELTKLSNIQSAVKEGFQEAPDADATHPSLEERLAAIGANPDMEVEPVGPPAFQTMLPEKTRERLMRDLNQEWVKAVNDFVRLE